MASVVIPGGNTPEFKWQGWSNGEKYQNPPKSLKPPTNIYPPPPKKKKFHAEILSLKNLQKVLNIKRAAKHWTAETSLVLYFILRTTRLAYADLPLILRLIWICPNKIPTWIKPTKKYCQIFLPKKSRSRTQKALPDHLVFLTPEYSTPSPYSWAFDQPRSLKTIQESHKVRHSLWFALKKV